MDGRRYGLSVGLKEREKVIVAVAGQVGRAEIGQQLIWICEFWNKLVRHGVAEWLVRSHKAVGHVWWV